MILVDTLDQRKSWPETLLPILDVVTSGKLTAILGSAQAVWDIATRIRDKAGYHGIYEILSYDAVLELQDPEGHEATLTRCEHIRFLQDNIIAVHDTRGVMARSSPNISVSQGNLSIFMRMAHNGKF